MKILRTFMLAASVMMFAGCDQLTEALNFAQCKYEYDSISSPKLGNVGLSGNMSALEIAQVAAMLASNPSSLPMSFDLNLDVNNPNEKNASISGLDYILSIDEVQFTTGSVNHQVTVEAGENAIVPLTMGFDLAELLKGESLTAATNLVMNIIGRNASSQSDVTLQVRPSVTVAGVSIPAPVYIPVNFKLGAK